MSVVIHSHYVLGLRTSVTGNVCVCDRHTVVFPSGNSCVWYNTHLGWQRILHGSENSEGMHAMTISANRRYLAVSERVRDPIITVFDLHHEQGTRRKVLRAEELQVQDYVSLSFSQDSQYLVGLTRGPHWGLVLWLWDKHRVLASVTTNNPTYGVNQVSFNPHNNTQMCVTGDATFKLFRYFEGSLKQSNFTKVERGNFLCHVWASEERVLACTATGTILVFDCGDLRREMVLSSDSSAMMMKRIKDADEGPARPAITAMISSSRGFACSLSPGTVSMFEKTEEGTYTRIRDIEIPPPPSCNDLSPSKDQIHSMSLSPAEETLVVSTHGGQLYSISLTTDHTHKEGRSYFGFLPQAFHSDAITGLSVCVRKPLVATSSLDRSVRIWNYQTKVLELYQQFQEEALSVALHPSGLSILVGFSDKLRLMNLVMDQIRTFKEFTVRGCKECVFSHGGHMFAAANGNVINIYSVWSLENVGNLKGHGGKVSSVKWSLDDSRLVSVGTDGAVYQWNTHTGKREAESVLKTCSYTDVCFSSDYTTVLTVGTDLTMKEIQDCQVLRELPADGDVITALSVSPSGKAVFAGTSRGDVMVVKYPLPSQREWTTHQGHGGAVTKMVVTYDGHFLLSASEDGVLMMWRITDKEGRSLKTTRQIVHTQEVLVTKSDLEEKELHLQDLRTRLQELQMENQYQLRLKDINHNEKMKQLSHRLSQEVEVLRRTEQEMTTQMEKQTQDHQQKAVEASTRHSTEVKDLELSYSQKLIVEHDNFQDLQQKHQRMQEDFEKQLKASEETRSRETEELRKLHEDRLKEKTQLLAQCEEESQQKIRELNVIIRQMEEDEETKIHRLQVNYEKKVLSERETSSTLKSQCGVMNQKVHRLQKEINDRSTDINKLKQERQKLLGLIRSLENNMEDLKKQMFGHEKSSQDKENIISGLKKHNQELEKMKFVLDFQLNQLKKQSEPQQEDLRLKKERIHQLEEELVHIDKINSQLKISVSELKLRLQTKDKELNTEKEKVRDVETLLQRLKSDLHHSMDFIQDQKRLKEALKTIYSRYVTQPDRVENSRSDEDVRNAFIHQREHLEKTVSTLNIRMNKAAEEHDKVVTKVMKENVSLISEINDLRAELRLVRSQRKDHRAEVSTVTRSRSRSRSRSRTRSSCPVSEQEPQRGGGTN